MLGLRMVEGVGWVKYLLISVNLLVIVLVCFFFGCYFVWMNDGGDFVEYVVDVFVVVGVVKGFG